MRKRFFIRNIAAVLLLAFAAGVCSCIPQKSLGTLEIHFLDVGEADAMLIVCEGHAMMIDGGDTDDSRLIHAYLKEQGISRFDYVFATHTDADHVGGLAAALEYAPADSVYCSSAEGRTRAFNSFEKYAELNGNGIKIPEAGQSFSLGNAEFTVIAPLRAAEKDNNNSIVIRMAFGETSFLFAGDMEREEEDDLLASRAELSSTLLKIAHHGSAYSTSESFLNAVSPRYAVISVGENDYGHPKEEVLERLNNVGSRVLRTDEIGHIVCRSDGKSLTFETRRSGSAPSRSLSETTASPFSPTEAEERDYVLNKRTMVFHYPSCESAEKMSEKNRELFTGTRAEVIARGYRPCGNCKP